MSRPEPDETRADTGPRTRPRADVWIAALLGAVVLGVGFIAVNPFPVGVLHDDAVYVILAKSLATGHGYRYLNLPGEPLATHFPPGYPLFLAALWWVADFPRNVFIFKCANAVLLAAGYWGLGTLLRRSDVFTGRVAWGVAFGAIVGVPMLLVSTLVLSETLFFALAVASLVAAQRAIDAPASMRDLVLAGVLCGVATLVRTPGLALIAAVVLCLLFLRRVRDAVVVAVTSALFVLPWQIWSQAHSRDVPDVLQGAYGSYSAWLGDAVRDQGIRLLFQTIAVTARQAADVVSITVSPFSTPALTYLAALCLAPVAALGMRAAWRSIPGLPAFLGFYAVLVLIWPSAPARYIWGMWPLVVVILAIGLRAIVSLPTRALRVALMLVTVVPALGYVKYNLTGYSQRAWLRIPEQGGIMLRPLVNGVRSRIPEGMTVAVTAEAAVYLYADRRSVPIYRFTVDELFRGPDIAVQTRAIAEILKAFPVDAVVASTELQRAALSRASAGMVPVDSFPGGVIYRRR